MSSKKRKKAKSKKLNQNIAVIITCIAVAALIIAGISVALDGKDDNIPDYSRTDLQNSVSDPKNDDENESPSVNEEKEPSSSEEPKSDQGSTAPAEPSNTVTPSVNNSQTGSSALTGSFYDTVKYRSPDAVPADIFKHGRTLMLLNRQYELPVDFKWDLVYWSNGQSVDAMYLNCEEHNSVKAVDRAAYQPLKDMFAAAEKAGVPLQLVSAYRSIYLQDKLFTRSVNSYINQGYSEAQAIEKANFSRTFSGTSEHNTGLGFDILQRGNFTLSESFENSAQFRWLTENAEDYGFILRYPKEKVDVTGIMYEPWHFRYVGIEHAKRINELGMCFEEYIDYLEG